VDAVCGHDPAIDVLEGLESLLNKSLLGLDAKLDGEPRFVMLEMIHEYARERLEEGGEARDIQRRHAEYFLALTEHAEAEFNVVRQEYWNTRLTDELDNIRTAFNWALDSGAVEFGARLVAALRDFWVWNGFLSESSAWIDRALESEERISPVVRAKTLNTSSRLAFICGEHTRGETLARQALSLAQESDDKVNCAWALLYLSSHLSAFDEKIEEAITRAEESLTLFRELDHKAGTAHSLNMLGELARLDGDYGRAGKLYEECLTLSCETGNKEREALSLGNLSYVAYHLGNFDEAIDYSKKALALSNSLQMAYASTLCIATIAGPICAKGNPRRAARLLSASEGQFEAMGASIQPGDKLEVDQFKNAIREQLGEIEFNKVWAEGQTMSLEEAVTSALGNDIE
jgi:non-specific serine/threonine protein kinase